MFCFDIGEDPHGSFPDFDHLLNDYIHHLYMSEAGKSKADDTIYGISCSPLSSKVHLPVSMLALRGWNKIYPVLSYPPLTWELTVLHCSQNIHPLLASGYWHFGCLRLFLPHRRVSWSQA